MKAYIILTGLLLVGKLALAQEAQPNPASRALIDDRTEKKVTIDNSKSPLYIIKAGDEQIATGKNSDVIERIKTVCIVSVNALKKKDEIKPYGKAGKNGVVIITIDKDKCPELYQSFKDEAEKKVH
jgi:hypothetical protein